MMIVTQIGLNNFLRDIPFAFYETQLPENSNPENKCARVQILKIVLNFQDYFLNARSDLSPDCSVCLFAC